MDLNTPLQYVKGIGPVRASILAAKELHTVHDLLYYLPFRYEDRRNRKSIAELVPGEKAALIVRVASGRSKRFRGRHQGLFEATLEDGSGSVDARWFHGERHSETLVPGRMIALWGKVEWDAPTHRRILVQPEVELLGDHSDELLHTTGVVPVYEAAGKLTTRTFRTLLDGLLDRVLDAGVLEDSLPPSIREAARLPDLRTSLKQVHWPEADANVTLLNAWRSPAQHRLIFEEFFWLECGLAIKKRRAREANGIVYRITERVRDQMRKMLPFRPTPDQRRVAQEIADDMKQPHPMNRLLQGDVGSGKTIVAAEAAVIAIENGYQVAFLAPTEILAQQHYATLRMQMQRIGVEVGLLTGSMSPREKAQTKLLLSEGLLPVVVGTHALLQEDVAFARFGLAIIDEQHRFGVRQKWELFRKGGLPGSGQAPDVLVMTATPIPRTLALTLYGDLDVSTIRQLPPGRKPVTTRHMSQDHIETVYNVVRREIEAGHQAYFVYPLVEESEVASLKAAEQMMRLLSTEVFPTYPVGLLHGRMAPEEKGAVMSAFKRGELKILVSTTVVEVGVDVPNASVMVIEQAERFGLAQLHQLRGRVGRGSRQSHCLLVTEKLNDIAGERIRTMVDSNDGFYIAEMDMKLRGPGEMFGTRQSGIPGLRLADLFRDSDILEEARTAAKAFLESGDAKPEELRQAVHYIRDNWQRRYGLVEVA